MYARRVFFALFCASGLSGIYCQETESFRIPSGGDNCNVVNLNFGSGEYGQSEARGPQGPPGKGGSPGLQGVKGDKGQEGQVGPQGRTPEINMAELTSAVMKALATSSCDELSNQHGISGTGYYLMRKNGNVNPVYTYCNFETYDGVSNCVQLIGRFGDDTINGYYMFGDRQNFTYCTALPKGCEDVDREDAKILQPSGGVFDIDPKTTGELMEVNCDLETDGGGWTIFQRRFDGTVDFFRGWDDYVNGFGEKDQEFWLGLETIYQLTKDGQYELRIDLTDWSGNTAYAKYGTFSISSGEDNYRLSVADFSGTARDSFTSASFNRHSNMQFSTHDADHDTWSPGKNCAQKFKGGWWYSGCFSSNLNGLYNKGSGTGSTGNGWYPWKTSWAFLKATEMKFRKKT